MNDVSKLLEWLSNLDQYKSTEKGLHRKPQVKSLKKSISSACNLLSQTNPDYFSSKITLDDFYHKLPTMTEFVGNDVLNLERFLGELIQGLPANSESQPHRSAEDAKNHLNLVRENFEWLLFLDFEYNQYRLGGSDKFTESIVDFGLVAVRSDNLEAAFELDSLILPFPEMKMGRHCEEKTGISTEMLQGMPNFENFYLENLKSFLDEQQKCIFVHWGGIEQKAFNRELRRISQPELNHSFLDLQSIYAKIHGRDTMGLKRAVQNLGLESELKEHRAISDAIYTARVFKALS